MVPCLLIALMTLENEQDKGYATAAKNLYNLGHFVGDYNILLKNE